MEHANVLEKRKSTWGLLFIGFCCVFGWLAMNYILLTHFTNWRHFSDVTALLRTLLMSLVCSSFYAIIGAVTLTCGIRRFKRTQRKKNLIKGSLIPAAILTPLLGIGGVALMICTPFVFGHIRALVAGPKIVHSADSTNGTYRAYVVDKPSLDGPNHHLYIKDIGTGESAFVTNLPEDVDFNKEILWSPFNDLVVFRTHFKVIIYSPENARSEEVKLGGDYHWRKNGTFWVDYKDVKKPHNFQFPEPGVFSYQLEGDEELYKIDMNEL